MAAARSAPSKPRFFESVAVFHRWLGEHHANARELLVGFHKKHANRGLTYSEALDEALCFGWIDGVRKRLDEDAYAIRFTPRKPGSIWSAVNIARARALEAAGRMQASGLQAFHGRDERKERQYSYEREHAVLDRSLDAKLRANRMAAGFFDAQPPGYRRIVTFWIMQAKKPETRERRLAHLIERSASGARIDLLNPKPKG
jgi:uncharacterized protein YdeI (YjbR/CyaY-like superfamily)